MRFSVLLAALLAVLIVGCSGAAAPKLAPSPSARVEPNVTPTESAALAAANQRAADLEATVAALQKQSANSPTPIPAFVLPNSADCSGGYPVKFTLAGVVYVPDDGTAYSIASPARCFDTQAHAEGDGGKRPAVAPSVRTVPASPTPVNLDIAAVERAGLEFCARERQAVVLSNGNLLRTIVRGFQAGSEPRQDLAVGAGIALAKGIAERAQTLFRANPCAAPDEYARLTEASIAAYVDGITLLGDAYIADDQAGEATAIRRIAEGDALSMQATQVLVQNRVTVPGS